MDNGQLSNNNQNIQNVQNNQNNQIGSEEIKIVTFQMSQMTQMIPVNLPDISMLNVKQINFLQNLGNYNKIRILCDNQSCFSPCHSSKIFSVLGINEKGEESLLMTAANEEVHCDSIGYMLVYRANNIIFGALGYQYNPICCEISSGCSCGCDCTCTCCACCACDCCTNCCKGGGCCVGGCCTNQGCCCCCEDGCCLGGCCTCCNCCCFEGGCCKEPICKEGCFSCPNWEKILLDVRFLNTIEEALNKMAGLYVSTIYTPYDCCGICPKYFGYKKCGEKFAVENKCFPYCDTQLKIIDLEKKSNAGNVQQRKTFCCAPQSFDVDFPENALPLEKLLIISEIFMYSCINFDLKLKNQLIITRKRKMFPGLEPNFM